MAIDTTFRSTEPEIMDDFSLHGDELRDALDKIAKINQLLGGNKVIIDGINVLLLKNQLSAKIVTIVDFGCGNGDMLRAVADYFQKKKITLRLIGIDANAFTITVAKELSVHYNIEYLCEDLFNTDLAKLDYDIGLCTLTLHHFANDDIENLVANLFKNANVGLVINDLQRSKVAYTLFGLVCDVFKLNRMSRLDGQVSILRGFKKCDLLAYSKNLKLKHYTIKWRWAFRYQWIIKKI